MDKLKKILFCYVFFIFLVPSNKSYAMTFDEIINYHNSNNYNYITQYENVNNVFNDVISKYKNVCVGIRDVSSEGLYGNPIIDYYLVYNNLESLKLHYENNYIYCTVGNGQVSYKSGTIYPNNGSINNGLTGGNGRVGLVRTNKNDNFYVLKGDVTYDGKILDTTPFVEVPSEFIWKGDGIRIDSPPDDSKIKGYVQKQSDNYKYYDIVLYGKYKSKNGLFDTINSIKSYIQNSITVSHNGVTKRVGEGVGIKDFKWIIEPKNGQEARFKIVLYQGMWKTGISDLEVKLSVKHFDGEKVTYTDVNKNINFLSDNQDDNLYSPPVDDDGAIGGSWNENLDGTIIDSTNKPILPDSVNVVDWIVYIIEYITYLITSLITALTTIINEVVNAFSSLINEFTTAIAKFTQIFGMLPSPMPQLITLSLTTVCLTTIVKFIRG